MQSLIKRKSKVSIGSFGEIDKNLFKSLPNILAGSDLLDIVNIITAQIRHDPKLPIILMMGGHPIKVGVSPFIIDLANRGIISHIAMNGSGLVHDLEIAMEGNTSEDVEESLCNGNFGETEETINVINSIFCDSIHSDNDSLGDIAKRTIKDMEYENYSIIASKAEVTIHQQLGCDVYHKFTNGQGLKYSINDYRSFRCAIDILVINGGIIINLGSAVVMPELFLKALSASLSGHPNNNQMQQVTTINMDFIPQYRAINNIVKRPKLLGARGYNLIGHHEIMFPLLYHLIMGGL